MLVDVVTCYESNEERAFLIRDALISKGFEVNIITSDFSHIRKEKRATVQEGLIVIKTKPYNKNLSIERINSHICFAKDAFKVIEKQNPELVWLMAPANSLIKEANKYKQDHKVKLIIDIIDMWPESLPININKNLFPFNIWRSIRKNNINCANALISECDLYKEILNKEYRKEIKTIYWAREADKVDKNLKLPKDCLSLCYIGSINNIIDIEMIGDLIKHTDRSVELNIIGEGEKTEEMIANMGKVCKVIYHGAIRDEKRKNEIFNRCYAGINIYKENLYIGLTVKCIDYFKYGLPIINNIKGDTWNFVENNKVGINVTRETLINSEKIVTMRLNNQNIYDLFFNNFTKEVFMKKCLETVNEVCNETDCFDVCI